MKVKLKTIVAGVDFSDASEAALAEANRLAMGEGGHLHINHIIPINEVELLMKESKDNEEVISTVDKELRSFAAQTSNLYNKKAYHVMVGHPFLEMMKFLEEVDADLLVIGSHGPAQGHHYVGGVASKCIRRSPVPVLVVRKQHQEAFEQIVVCMDFSETAMKALDYAAEIAANEGAELHLLNVHVDQWAIYSFPLTETNQSEVQKYLAAEKQAVKDKLEKIATSVLEAYPGVSVSTHEVSTVGVTQAIIEFVKVKKIDLVVAGTHGHSKLTEFFIGTTTERLVHTCPCSVLTVSPD
jgi:universal stress protein E